MFKYLWKHLKKTLSNERGIWPALAFLANPAFWSGAANAAGAAGGIMSMFGGKKKGGSVNMEDYYPSWTKTAANTLAPWVKQYLPQFQPGAAYGGKMTAGATPFETSGLDILSKYMNAPNTGELFGAGKQQIMDTLGGRFADPNESPFIKSMIDMSKMNLTDLINQTRARRGGRGTYYTEEGLREEGDIGARSQANLDAIIGQFIQNERQNMLGAVPQATQMDEYESVLAPLKKITASQTLGSLQRTIEQADLEKKYQDFVRQRQEMAMPLQEANVLMGGQLGGGGILNQPNTQSNPLASLLNMFGSNSQLMQLLQGIFKGGGTTGTNNISNITSMLEPSVDLKAKFPGFFWNQ